MGASGGLGMSGGGLAPTLPDGFADAVAGPASGIEAALEGGEGAVGIRGDLTLGMFDVVGLPEAVLLILVERHFGKGQPAELPDEGDVLVDEVAKFGGVGGGIGRNIRRRGVRGRRPSRWGGRGLLREGRF